MRVALLLFVALTIAICCSAQLKKQRLIARTAYWDAGPNGCCFELYDSVFFKYSGSRGSRFNEGIMDYFDPRQLVNGSEIMRQGTIINPNNVDSDEHTTCATFDTMRYYTFTSYYGNLMERMETCEYYPDGKPHIATHTHYDPNPSYTRDLAEYKYFNNDLIREEYSSESSTTPNMKSGVRFLIRDAFGNVVIDSVINDALHYEYDAQGRYISRSGGYWLGGGLFKYPDPVLYDYYQDGRVRTIKEMRPTSTGGYEVDSYDTFSYTPGVRGYTTLTYYTLPPGYPPSQNYEYSSHLNAAGLKDTVVEDFYNGSYQTYHEVEYNAFGNPVSVTTYNVLDTQKINFIKTYFYYELYDDALNAPAALVHPYTVAVSPNPTTGNIKLNFGNSIPPGPIGVHITNITGKLVYSESIALNGSTTVIMLGSEKPPGIYTIRISGSIGEELYKGTIVKY